MKDVTFFNCITLTLPSNWVVRREDHGLWGCHDAADDGAMLWVDYDLGLLEPPAQDSFRATSDTLLLDALRQPGTREARILDMDQGPAVSVIRDSLEEDEAPVRSWYLHHLRRAEDQLLTVHLTYVVPMRLLELDHHRQAAFAMERSMREAHIGDWTSLKPEKLLIA